MSKDIYIDDNKDLEKIHLRRAFLIVFSFVMVIALAMVGYVGYLMFYAPKGELKEITVTQDTNFEYPVSHVYEYENFKYVIDKVDPVNEEFTYTYQVRIIEYTGKEKKITIPRIIDGKFVYRIGNSAFYQNENIENVTFHANIVKIDPYAFYKCSNLSVVSFPFKDNVLEIGDNAFYGCDIKELKFLNTRLTIGNGTFAMNTNLEKVEFDSRCFLKVGSNAFRNTALKQVDLPNNTSYVGSFAFANCYKLSKVNYPDNDELTLGHDITKKSYNRYIPNTTTAAKTTNTSSSASETNTTAEDVTTKAPETVESSDTVSEPGTIEYETRRQSLIDRFFDRLF